MSDYDADYWIAALGLSEHPEGGYYRRVYQSEESIPAHALPGRFGGDTRLFASAIHYLIKAGRPSRLHRIKSDELWHFHTGSPVRLHLFSPDGKREDRWLGPDPHRGQVWQTAVPHGHWFAAEVPAGKFALCGCTVAPGFEFADLELADRERLKAAFPAHRALIEKLT